MGGRSAIERGRPKVYIGGTRRGRSELIKEPFEAVSGHPVGDPGDRESERDLEPADVYVPDPE